MAKENKQLLEFFKMIGVLKETRRAGWVRKKVKNPESVAGHMYRMAIMAFLVPPDCDKDRCIKIALVHDMAECIVGDITPYDNIPVDEKHKREQEAMDHLCSMVPVESAKELKELYMEYESASSREAIFVKDLDKFDMILQAFQYEQKENRLGDFESFFNNTQGKFQTETVQQWVETLRQTRNKLLDDMTSQKDDKQESRQEMSTS